MSESEWIPRLMQEKVFLERKCIALEMANEKLAAEKEGLDKLCEAMAVKDGKQFAVMQNIAAELAELKAKMEGVVPVDRELLDFAVSEQFLLFCDEEEFLDIAKSVLGRFARLNSSTVSAGDDAQYPPCDYCAEPLSYHPWHGSGLINGVESRHIHACDKCRHLLPTVSAGEPVYQFQCREIGEGGFEPCDYNRYVYCQKSPEHDTRVVQVGLQAPSHGEQEGKEFSQFLSAVMTAAGLVRHGRQSKELSEYLGRMCMQYMTAAPSAGSQGGDV